MGSDSAISIGSSPQDSNDSDATSPMISDLSPPGFNSSITGLPRVSENVCPDSNKSDTTLPKVPSLGPPDPNRSGFTLPGFPNSLPPNNSSTQLENYPNPLVPNNFRPPAPYKFGPIVENYSGVTDQRNLRLPIPDGHTLNPSPLIPPKLILSHPCLPCSRDLPSGPPCNGVQPCFECVKSNKFCSFPRSAYLAEPDLLYIPVYLPYYQSWECSRDPSSRQKFVAAVKRTMTMAELVKDLRCNHPILHPIPEHKLTDQVATAVIAIPLIPSDIFFRYYLQGIEVWANDYVLVRDLKWGNDDCMEVRAFNLDTGIEYHGCMAGWCQKSE
ncbi:hypothetical protein BHYA_0251g00070 [Botrytis hyacinthi]|uniref:Uncharacterized protein n=1 Tax=Botrytis hyacinthi TaxID=278943 RepID=A0A4Z1GCZ0_9HELO|nr:hypothetical protein BHYA_0251g00070 [Botrytis hyacinthi]